MVSAFALDAAGGKLTLLNQLPALGEDPCYISFDRSGKFVLIANYSSGNVAVFPILPDGTLGEHTAVVQDSGALGPNKERQEAPHAHWIEPSAHNRFVYVADLGLDRVLIYKFDAAKGALTPGANSNSANPGEAFSATLNPGTGPRHVAFSRDGNFMYVLGELQSNVTVFKNDARETFRQVQQISALPAGFSGRNDAAEIAIHPSGKSLYTSNRGQESIAVFAIEPVGTAFIRLMTMIVLPLVVSSLLVGTASLGDVRRVGSVGGRTLVFSVGITIAAACVGLLAFNFRPASLFVGRGGRLGLGGTRGATPGPGPATSSTAASQCISRFATPGAATSPRSAPAILYVAHPEAGPQHADQHRTDEASRPDLANYLPGHPASFVRFVRTVGSPQSCSGARYRRSVISGRFLPET